MRRCTILDNHAHETPDLPSRPHPKLRLCAGKRNITAHDGLAERRTSCASIHVWEVRQSWLTLESELVHRGSDGSEPVDQTDPRRDLRVLFLQQGQYPNRHR